jgi:hypothetical protein
MENNIVETVRQSIKKNKPNLSTGSIATYLSSFRKLRNESGVRLESIQDIVDNHAELLDYMMKNMSETSRKSKLACLITIINDPEKEDDEKLQKVLEVFRRQMLLDSRVVEENYNKQELTENQKKNLIDQSEVKTIYEKLKSQATPLFKFDMLNKQQFNLLQSYVLLSLYVLIPPRRSTDYIMFKIRNFDTSTASADNYMFNFNKNKKKPSSFVFNTYKNANRLGRQIIEIPKSLQKIIEEWSKFNKSDYLLVNGLGKPVAPSKITLWLNGIFGKSISSSMLRHIFLTDKFGNVDLNELQKTASDMGQSEITTALRYVQKDADSVIKENKKE